MADPVLHIKDSYYFEVPKRLWRYHYTDYDQVPASMDFLKDEADHLHLSIDQFDRAMDGKILIPQPFAKLKNLYQVESGFGISKFMVLELFAAIVLFVVFSRLAKRMNSQHQPQGRAWNMLEAMLLFIRDQVVRPAIGDHDDHAHHDDHEENGVQGHLDHAVPVPAEHGAFRAHPADKLLPLFWTMFFFILACNLLGLIPWLGSPTGAFGVTFGLACITFAATLVLGIMKFGPVGFWFNQVPSMDLPWYMRPLKLMIFAIEVMGLLIKHLVLSIRLLANMVAGHLVLLGILGLIAGAAAATSGTWTLVTFISVFGSTLFSCLELFVAFLQAYVFTFLSALFIGAAMHHH
jgi:F-type H+-transporting ATPase subunit a